MTAIIPIEKDEEIFIQDYETTNMTYQDRVRVFGDDWDFQCACSLCTIESLMNEDDEEDFRRRHLPQLLKEKLHKGFHRDEEGGVSLTKAKFDGVVQGDDKSGKVPAGIMEESQVYWLRAQNRSTPPKLKEEDTTAAFQVVVSFFQSRPTFLKNASSNGTFPLDKDFIKTLMYYAKYMRRCMRVVPVLFQKVGDLQARDDRGTAARAATIARGAAASSRNSSISSLRSSMFSFDTKQEIDNKGEDDSNDDDDNKDDDDNNDDDDEEPNPVLKRITKKRKAAGNATPSEAGKRQRQTRREVVREK
ncbi:hypothetical protein K490DRAFT_56996 [Saccharata proteae CBS 121410]|uniref:Uncharacterized protein n=1 Tax=Saccharata proteae CBS 121410 TaxID=1314787 RepID=A0A9P4LX95_9PEZI|nr:hypothetical protein K490DRAFT_56996 [Saccharata proteae CBS 121410]